MGYVTLGNTGLLVSKLCFGTMTFGDGRGLFKAISAVGQAGPGELVKTSIVAGINFFDTADNYTEGESGAGLKCRSPERELEFNRRGVAPRSPRSRTTVEGSAQPPRRHGGEAPFSYSGGGALLRFPHVRRIAAGGSRLCADRVCSS